MHKIRLDRPQSRRILRICAELPLPSNSAAPFSRRNGDSASNVVLIRRKNFSSSTNDRGGGEGGGAKDQKTTSTSTSTSDLLKKLKTAKEAPKSEFDLSSIKTGVFEGQRSTKPQARRGRILMKTLKLAQLKAGQRHQLKEASEEEKILGKEMYKAVTNVSEILGKSEIKSDILKKLISVEKETFDQSKPAGATFYETLSNMKVTGAEKDRTGQDSDDADAERQVDEVTRLFSRFGARKFASAPKDKRGGFYQTERTRRPKAEAGEAYEIVDIYVGERLNIFNQSDFDADQLVSPADQSAQPTYYDVLEKRHFDWLTDVSPRNGFEEMIRWTEEGKMYPYPIDNEYGFYEKHVPFHQHVFLERHLHADDPRVPKSGPVRQFLDLVLIGLSKNPYMTVERKAEHLEWFKEYFKEKLEEIEKLKLDEDSVNMQAV